MIEAEVKILEIDRKDIEKKLLSTGAKKVFDDEIDAFFFDFDDSRIKKDHNHLRLRKEGDKATLTFKVHLSNKGAKVCEEYETEVSDFDSMKSILESIGLKVFRRMVKNRISYKLEGVSFEIDKYKGEYESIPEFLEIEAEDLKTIYKYA
ncbi:MAG: CYTH domain-containing protein, partial [Nanoarchaeota archaeon]|nr:CYTH domain-containing protein [Nanoarchaeota archaeon]